MNIASYNAGFSVANRLNACAARLSACWCGPSPRRAAPRVSVDKLWTMFYAAMPDMQVTQEDLIISGDRVIGRYTYRGTQTGEFMGIPASGNPIEMRSIDIWRVKDGMFVEHWDELNVLEVFQQMGVIPPLQVAPIEAA
jgi:predicted SnoaL-like aldol condensation-catalyzing enzyme